MGTQNSSNQYTLCDGVSNRHFPLTMKFLLFFTTFCLLLHCYKSDFAAQLDAFISDTPAGYTVAQEVRNGQTCHCRVPSLENVTTTFQPTTTTTQPRPPRQVECLAVDCSQDD